MAELIIPLITLAVTGTEMGMKIAGVGQPSQGDILKQQTQADKQSQAEADLKQLELSKKAFLASRGDAQAQGGGYLTDTSMMGLMGALSGMPGMSMTTSPSLGTVGQPSPGIQPSQGGGALQEILSQLPPGGMPTQFSGATV